MHFVQSDIIGFELCLIGAEDARSVFLFIGSKMRGD